MEKEHQEHWNIDWSIDWHTYIVADDDDDDGSDFDACDQWSPSSSSSFSYFH